MLAEVTELLGRILDAEGHSEGVFATAVSGLKLLRFFGETAPAHLLYKPTLCVAVQGTKHALFGDRAYDYGARQGLVVGLDIPASSRVRQASPDRPFLGVTVDLDIAVMQEITEQIGIAPRPGSHTDAAVFVMNISGDLEECLVRLIRLLEQPQSLRVLYPSIQRELYYWLAVGPHGAQVCRLVWRHTPVQRIAKSLALLRDNYQQPISVRQLADLARMSPSTFHQHFRKLTSLSPLQYQKQLRLLEARRLMLERSVNAETAARSVGYESASQFSREYARRFGAPPKRDTTKLTAEVT